MNGAVAALRSLVFNLLFFAWAGLMCILCLPALALPRRVAAACGRLWARGVVALLRVTIGLDYELRGLEHRVEPAIYAFKHQSAWETVMLPLLIADPAVVLKQDLLNLPLFGWYLLKTGQIAVDRRGGAKALKRMVREARARAGAGRPIAIFPEGTRTPPGTHRPYQPGVAAIYDALRLPVVPVALDSGLYWRRRSFSKRPGRIVVEFLPPIEPGLKHRAFLAELERRIEPACARLLAERGALAATPPAAA